MQEARGSDHRSGPTRRISPRPGQVSAGRKVNPGFLTPRRRRFYMYFKTDNLRTHYYQN